MPNEIAVTAIQEISKLAGAAVRAWGDRKVVEAAPDIRPPAERCKAEASTPKSQIDLPTTAETVAQLKQDLYHQLNQAVSDLARNLRIIKKPCTCLELKHQDEIISACRELIPMDPHNTVYQDIIQWFDDNGFKVIPEAITSGRFDKEYPIFASQFRTFRDRIGYRNEAAIRKLNEVLSKGPVIDTPQTIEHELTLEEAKQLAADRAAQEVERRWNSKKS